MKYLVLTLNSEVNEVRNGRKKISESDLALILIIIVALHEIVNLL